MSANTKIAWTDHTFNPWWGCTKVAQGCTNCYAETFAERTGHGIWGAKAPRRFFGDKHWAEPMKWDQQAEADGTRPKVFCGSMCDILEDRADLDKPRERLRCLIEATPHLTWQLLTKRPEHYGMFGWDVWPENVWAGASAANQEEADEASKLLSYAASNAPVRFLSLEPMIGPIRLKMSTMVVIDWIIVGGESGNTRRPFEIEWLDELVNDARVYCIPLFVKQDGARKPGQQGRIPDALFLKEFPR